MNINLLKDNNVYINNLNQLFFKKWNRIPVDNLDYKDILIKTTSEIFSKKEDCSFIKNLYLIFEELLVNAFMSKIEYKFRQSKKDNYSDYDDFKKINIFETKIDVCLSIFKDSKFNSFYVISNSKISDYSDKLIRKILNSKSIMEFPNLFNDDYKSITGKSGIGIFMINQLLEKEYDSKLIYEYIDNKIIFKFKIKHNN